MKPTDFCQFPQESGESLLQNINAINKIQKSRFQALANYQENIQLHSEHTAFQIKKPSIATFLKKWQYSIPGDWERTKTHL